MPSEPLLPRRRFRTRYLLLGVALLVLLPFSPLLIFGIIGLVVPGVKTYSIPTTSMQSALMLGDYIVASTSGGAPEHGQVIIFEFPGNRDEVEPDLPQKYLERCVAIAGDTVQIINNVVWVNGNRQQSPATLTFDSALATLPGDDAVRSFPKSIGFTRDNWGPMRVPKKGDVIQLDAGTLDAWQIFIRREGHTAEQRGTEISIDGRPATSYQVEHDYCFGLGDNRWNSMDSRYWGFIPYDAIVGRPLFVYWSWPTAADRNKDGVPNQYDPEEALSLWERIAAIRWGRMFQSIE